MDWGTLLSIGVTLIMGIGGPIVGFVVGNIRAEIRDLWAALNKVRDVLADHKVESLKMFAPSTDITTLKSDMDKRLDNIESLLRQVLQRGPCPMVGRHEPSCG